MNQKNVLMICTDHWAASYLGCAGHPVLMTPTLDYLAAGGIRFENCYSECPVCNRMEPQTSRGSCLF